MKTKIASFFPALLLLLILTSCSGDSGSAPVGVSAPSTGGSPVTVTDRGSSGSPVTVTDGGSAGSTDDGTASESPGSSNDDTAGITGGIAVDPYIVGATFFEDVNGNGRWDEGEQISTPSNEQGSFTFPNRVPTGRNIVMLDRGYHQGLPFSGQLIRRVEEGDSGTVVVTPMTTMVALGISESELASALTLLNTYRNDYDLDVDPLSATTAISAATAGGDDSERAMAGLRANLYLGAVLEILALDRGSSEGITVYELRYMLNNWAPLVDLMNGLRNAASADTFNYINLPAGYTGLPPVTMREVAEAMPAILNWWKQELVRRVLAGDDVTLTAAEFVAKLDAVQEELVLRYYVRNNRNNSAVQTAIADGFLPAVPVSHVALTKNGNVGPIEQISQDDLVGQRLAVGNGSRLRLLPNGVDNEGTAELTYLNSYGHSTQVNGRWRIEGNILVLQENDSDMHLRLELVTDWQSHLALRVVSELQNGYGTDSFIGRLLTESDQFRVTAS